MIAPASLRRATAAASCAGTQSLRIRDPAVVLVARVANRSLTAIGTPSSAPASPRASRRSPPPPRAPPPPPPGLLPSPLPGKGDKGVQAARLFDPPGIGVHQLERGHRSLAQGPRDLDQRGFGQRLNRRHPNPQAPSSLSVLRPAPGTASRLAADRLPPGRSAEGRRLAQRRPAVPSPSPAQYAIRGRSPVIGSIITCECEMV